MSGSWRTDGDVCSRSAVCFQASADLNSEFFPRCRLLPFRQKSCGRPKWIRTPAPCWPSTGRGSTVIKISGMSMSNPINAISSAEGSHAKICPPWAGMPVSPGGDLDCGPSSCGSFAHYNPDSCSWRMCPPSGDTSVPFSGHWPTSGSMRNGTCSAPPRSVRRIVAADGSSSRGELLPTPLTSDATGGVDRNRTARKAENGTRYSQCRQLRDLVGGLPNPEFVEWMMGLVRGWTDVSADVASQSLQTRSSDSRQRTLF